jgi:hypothetical protein
MTDDKTYSKLHRAARAKTLLEDELHKECLDQVEQAFMRNWIATEPRDVSGRELMWNGLQGVILFRAVLQKIIADGKLAKRDLDELIVAQQRNNREFVS